MIWEVWADPHPPHSANAWLQRSKRITPVNASPTIEGVDRLIRSHISESHPIGESLNATLLTGARSQPPISRQTPVA